MLIKVGYIKSYDTRFTIFIQCGFLTQQVKKSETLDKIKLLFTFIFYYVLVLYLKSSKKVSFFQFMEIVI